MKKEEDPDRGGGAAGGGGGNHDEGTFNNIHNSMIFYIFSFIISYLSLFLSLFPLPQNKEGEIKVTKLQGE